MSATIKSIDIREENYLQGEINSKVKHELIV